MAKELGDPGGSLADAVEVVGQIWSEQERCRDGGFREGFRKAYRGFCESGVLSLREFWLQRLSKLSGLT